jgi:predicted metalloendopeptidase
VTNIAYPEFITNNTLLEAYYKDLQLSEDENFILSQIRAEKMYFKQMFAYLLRKRVDREEFGSSSVLVNAWYQPQVNSITLPAAILQPPFFDPDWPSAVNYGSLGVVVAHELSHGFGRSVKFTRIDSGLIYLCMRLSR